VAKVTDIESQHRKSKRPAKSSLDQQTKEKALQAYQLFLEGKSHSEIGEALDITHENDVYRMMAERFAYDASFLTDGERKGILGIELLRLNALQAAVWPAAMMGDPKSVDSAVRIIATRAKISGLEQVDPVVQKNLVLVMGEKEEDYIAALKAASDSQGA
jgi:hypothetical protein